MKLSELDGQYNIIAQPEKTPTFADFGKQKLSTAQATLVSSQKVADNVFRSPLQAFAQGDPQANIERTKGAAKQGLADIMSAGAQNAGPVGAHMLAGAPKFAEAVQGFKDFTTPANMEQQKGANDTAIGEMLFTGSGAKGLLSDFPLVSKFLKNRNTSKALEAVQSTAETMTKAERKAAIAEGRIEPTLTGGGTYKPSKTEQRTAELLAGKTHRNPVKNVPVVQNEIATRGKEVETYLEKNPQKITNEEDFNAFAKKRADMEKYSTPAEQRAYDETINIFQKVLKGKGEYNTANYYKAIKEFEDNVTRNIPKGKEALLVEGGSARLQAAKDVRSVVRDMIGSKHGEFKGKMYDLASLYDALDNVITKAEKVGSFAKRHPYISKGLQAVGIGAAGAVGGAGVIKANQ